jgi:transcriptional regulator with XRE-family HTH domain
LGDHLRKKRLDLKFLQKEVAQILGSDTTTVNNWEKNRTSPSLPFLPRIIAFLGYVPLAILPENMGERIVVYRRLSGLSQEDLARRLGIDSGTLGRWENGKSKPLKRIMEKLLEFIFPLSPQTGIKY